jgi:REP element-mobilizing transposase RayT
MAQSLSKIYVHLIFSTKNRERTLPDEIRPDLHAYMGGTLKGLGCLPIEINTEPDHLHGLFLLARTEALSGVVGHLKKSSNDWLRGRGPQFASFFWQAGFGAFSVSQSQVEDVRAYSCVSSYALVRPPQEGFPCDTLHDPRDWKPAKRNSKGERQVRPANRHGLDLSSPSSPDGERSS